MRSPFKLVADSLSHETIAAAQQIAEAAMAGDVIGLGVVVMMKDRRYFVNSAGECRRNPTWTRGALRDLDDELGQLTRGEQAR
jgi:hypothetical protein